MTIEKSVKETIKEQLGWGNTEQLTLSTSPQDIGLDSLDEIEIIMTLEEKFSTEISDDVAESFNTLGDIIIFLEKEHSSDKLRDYGCDFVGENTIIKSFPVPEDNVKKDIFEESLASVQAHFLTISDEEFIEECEKAGVYLKKYNPVKNISLEKYYRCAKRNPNLCDQFNSDKGILFMSESSCGKYYYWEEYNSKNEIICIRGEKSWVEDKYEKVASSSKFKTHDNGSLIIPDNLSTNEAMAYLCDYAEYLDKEDEYKKGFSEEGVDFSDHNTFVKDVPVVGDLTENKNEWTDKHYDFNYTLTEYDIEKGKIKIDPYFVNQQWKLNSKDDTGIIFHQLKTLARWCDKNTEEREIRALFGQVKRLAEIKGVEL